jgi:nitrate/nitrite-specific signal transduction histidine kinase
MKIGHVLVGGALSFLLLLVAILGATVYLLASGGGDSLYINLAGRQRMLSQKIAKESFSYANHPSPESLAILERSLIIFEHTHRALRMSGLAPLSLDNTNEAPVGGATDFAVIAKLDDVQAVWTELSAGIRELVTKAQSEAKALRVLEEECPRLLALSEEALVLEGSNAPVRVVNIAGRQRMLSQRIGLDVLLFQRDTTPATRAQLENDIKLFVTTHRARRYGGETQLHLEGAEVAFFSAATEPQMIKKLDQVEASLQRLELAIQELTSENNLNKAVATVAEINPRLLKTMDEAVTLAQHQADAKVRLLRNLQLATTVVGLAIVALAIWYSSRVGRSLARLRRAAEDISLGKLETVIELRGTGEIRDLARSFERMRTSLEAAMLEVDHHDRFAAKT